jgi:hypothetical protein
MQQHREEHESDQTNSFYRRNPVHSQHPKEMRDAIQGYASEMGLTTVIGKHHVDVNGKTWQVLQKLHERKKRGH